MKRITALILAMTLVLALASTAFASDILTNETMIFNSITGEKLPIVVAENASKTDMTAASKLQQYLKSCTNADFEIVTSAEKGIFVGAAAQSVDLTGVKDEGYRIKAIENGLAILGVGNRGTIYGVFAFLQKFLNCRWYTNEFFVLPKTDKIAVDSNTDIVFNPTFEYRETDWISGYHQEFSLANQLNSGAYRRFDEAHGGNVNYITHFAHTLATQFCSGGKYFEQNPELFAIHGGIRYGDQLCLSNEETYNIVLSEVMDILKANCDPADKSFQILSLTQNDNLNYCECEKCAQADEKYGSHAGSLLLFINRIAQAVEEAGYDNIGIDTFAYQYSRKAPVGIEPRHNVIIRLCSIECCFCHPLDDENCPDNVEFMKDIREWNKICNRLYIWDYTVNYARTLATFPDFHVLQRNLQVFAENGVKGVYEEGAYYAAGVDGEFAHLRCYLIAALLADPNLDFEKEMMGFLEAFYGPAAPYIREYILILEKAESENDHMSIYDSCDELFQSLEKKDIEYIDGLWKKAVEANGNEFQRANVKRSEISWVFWKADNKKGEFSRLQLPSVWMSNNEAFHQRLVEANIDTLSEGDHDFIREINDSNRKFILSSEPHYWTQRHFNDKEDYDNYVKKYDRLVNLEKYFGFILKPLFKVIYQLFG